MATATPGQQNEKYQNWLRGSVALLFLKEGIEGFIDKRVSDLHEKLHTTIPQPYSRHGPANQQHSQHQAFCTTCTHYNVQRSKNTWKVSCPSNVCSTWLKNIIGYHVGSDIARTNLKPQLWPSHPWEVAKCFLPVGSENVKSARDADVAAILKLLKNCHFISLCVRNPTLVEEVSKIRNGFMHSCDLAVTDDQLRQDTGMMINLLNSLDQLKPAEKQSVQRAIDNITELQSKTMNLTRDKEVTALHSRMQAVDSELAILRGKCIEYDKTRQDLSKTEQELKSLNDDNQMKKAQIKQLEESKEKFEKFLQDNDLEHDLARLSVKLKEHDQKFEQQDQVLNEQNQKIDQQDQKIDQQDQKIDQQSQKIDQQNQKIDQRIDQQDQKIDQQNQKIDQQDQKIDQRIDQQDQKIDQQIQKFSQQDQRFIEQDQKILTLAEQVQSKPEAPVASSSRSWDDKCKDLQAVLMSHYRNSCLIIQNPFENNDVGLEYMYVAPDIKVLRKSMGRDGFRNITEEVTRMSCKQVFYTKDYKCKNIYITGDAGTGKSMLCRNIVRLWCEAHGGITVVESEESEESESEESERDSDEDDDKMFDSEKSEESESDSDEDDDKMFGSRQAKKTRTEERKDSRKEDRQILSQFKLLFYITLRDSVSTYRITDMIQSQILQHYDIAEGLKASDLLKNECCLVICDGLDEWVCPEGSPVPHFVNSGIPGRDITIETSVFMTTTRPWKLDVLHLKSSELDKHVALVGISEHSASQLCCNVIKMIQKSNTCCKKKQDFFTKLNERGLGRFKEIPVILIQLICLWCDDKLLPKSQVQLYCDILEHLYKNSKKNIATEMTTLKDMQLNRPLPVCFKDHPYCQSHQQLIDCLSRIAFEALFDKRKENSLVFKSSQLEIFGLGQEAIDLCLKSGILSQNKMFDKVSVSEKKMSFLHKNLQEFLAALYIAGSVNSGGFFKRVLKKSSNKQINHVIDFCNTLDTCLEMSQVYMFLSGLRQDLAQQLLTHFTHVVTADKHKQIQKYRQTSYGEDLIQDIQTCITDCVVEGRYYGYTYVKLCLADFYITKTTLCHVKPLFLCTKSSKVKSVYMETEDIDRDQLTAITSQLQQCHSVQKLHLDDLKHCCIHIDTLTQIVNNNINTLTCLSFGSVVTATDKLVTAICSISSKCLMALWLSVCMTHKHKEQIIARFSQSPTIRQLGLALVCTDHVRQCRARIDLSTMTHIQRLYLWDMSVDNLQSVSHSVEYVTLGHVTLPVTALHEFTRSISQTTRYVKVELDNVTVTQVTDRQVTQVTDTQVTDGQVTEVTDRQITEVTDRQITQVTDRQVDMKTFFLTCHGLKVINCQYDDSNKTWTIHFTTSPQ